MALQRVTMTSPNQSSRGGAAVRLIVLHTAEGALSYQSLGNYFANPASQVSSHTGIDDTPGVIGEYVAGANKAWTAANANPYSVQTELCAFARWTVGEWAAHPVMLDNCARWVAEEAAIYGIPLVALSAAQAQDGRSRGVCQHFDLGSSGGGHWDCGTGFPMAQVIAAAASGSTPTTSAPSGGQEDSKVTVLTAPGRIDMFVIGTDQRIWQVFGKDYATMMSSRWIPLGTETDVGKSVSASWSPDYRCLYLAVHGSDDRVYTAEWNGAAWSPFVAQPYGQVLAT